MSASSAVRVVVRVRPLNAREQARNAKCLISMDPSTQSTTISPPDETDLGNTRAHRRRLEEDKQFTYDVSLWSVDPDDAHYADQSALHRCLGQEFVNHAFAGYNCCIFAYGQTGSGKTHSMMGSPLEPGLIPRICTGIFDQIEATKGDATFKVSINYYEIYNETATDLLLARDPRDRVKPLKVRESPETGPYLENLSEFQVKTYEDVQAFMQVGNQARRTASTKMNDTSSRSHAVFTLTIGQHCLDPDTQKNIEKTSRFRLVDLAGSERASATGASGERLREGANINKSLTTLGRVISKLAEPVRTGVVPYRDSILTWLLSDSLGGNSKTAMIACISPADYDETVTTLRYADAVKHISTNAKVNETTDMSVGAKRLDSELKEMSRLLMLSQQEKAELQRYEKQAYQLRELVENIQATSDAKIRSLETENEALRMHLRLAIESIRNPLPQFDDKSEGDEEEEDTDESNQADFEANMSSFDAFDQELNLLQREVAKYSDQIATDRMHYSSRSIVA
ncbi:Kinesin family protein [Taphrina deformans PYCC 5710]|uniref:Kinesin-like protein n=1 Tax=Taphrina deformans (strain PYCC 5710 / ATCC 11124 / CBS 356.35 / IMI 108563 / JCM 9778 / NBRC 8474) TaxID=1097556 RepID=R4XG97_TAPDE|nr:Kinesin family protein [Taphrina deformans PYCC 5710]|eukprot:CCG83519.1 Kinesin family protein [Taphrina deformans PYCC 5710]